MKLIAHRANYNGDKADENSPAKIQAALARGYDVEIDIRYAFLAKRFYLGHDSSTYGVTMEWLQKYKDVLWIHCKNVEAVVYFSECGYDFNYFWHQNDDYTLTSNGYIWTYVGKELSERSIMLLPEVHDAELNNARDVNCYAICSDYVEKIKAKIQS